MDSPGLAPASPVTPAGGSMSFSEGVAAMRAKRAEQSEQAAPAQPVTPTPPTPAATVTPEPEAVTPVTPAPTEGGSSEQDDVATLEQDAQGDEQQSQETTEEPEGDYVETDGGDRIPLAELLEAHKRVKGFQAHIQRKEQALAQERQTLETERQQIAQHSQQAEQTRQALLAEQQRAAEKARQWDGLLGEFSKQLDGKAQAFAQVDWRKLLHEDPIAYQERRLELEQHQAAQAALKAEREATQQELTKAEQAAHQAARRELNQWTRTAFPHWVDPVAKQQDLSAMAETATALGYKDTEITASTDPRGWAMLRKAALYDQLQRERSSVTEAKPVPSTDGKVRLVRGAATSPRPTTASAERAKVGSLFAKVDKTGSIADGVAALQAQRALRARKA